MYFVGYDRSPGSRAWVVLSALGPRRDTLRDSDELAHSLFPAAAGGRRP